MSYGIPKGSQTKMYYLKRLSTTHTCSGGEHKKRGSVHSLKFIKQAVSCLFPCSLLIKQVMEGMSVGYGTKPAQIQDWYRSRHGPLLYKTAQRIRNQIISNAQSVQAEQFTFIPSYVQHILESDPNSIAKLRIDPSHRFANLFICPSASRTAWQHLRPFIAIDAAFTKVIHHYVLLVAVGQDANQETVALAWGIAPVESFDHWGWFIDNLDTALGGLNRPGTVIMSDRQKGLNLAIARLLPQATEAYCGRHI